MVHKYLSDAVNYQPDSPQAWANLGVALAHIDNDYSKSVEAFTRVVPRAEAYCKVAFILNLQSKRDDAMLSLSDRSKSIRRCAWHAVSWRKCRLLGRRQKRSSGRPIRRTLTRKATSNWKNGRASRKACKPPVGRVGKCRSGRRCPPCRIWIWRPATAMTGNHLLRNPINECTTDGTLQTVNPLRVQLAAFLQGSICSSNCPS